MTKKFKGKSTAQIQEMVTGYVIEGLEKNICPWIKPWTSADGILGTPTNYSTKTEYHGGNVIVLTSIQMSKGYAHNKWVTYKGAKDLGGNVKKGEKGYPVVFWKFIVKEDEGKNGETKEKKIPYLRYFQVFNIDQCEGIKMPEVPKKKKVAKLKPIKNAEAMVKAYDLQEKKLTIKIENGNRAYFQPSTDTIVTPTMRQAVDKAKESGQTANDGKQHFYSTMFHEMVHSSGTKDRCNRDGITGGNHFGGHEYSKEELVAEIGSAILCAKAGLSSERVLENTQAYCKSWAKKLKSEPKWILWAGGRAEASAKYILNEKTAKK